MNRPPRLLLISRDADLQSDLRLGLAPLSGNLRVAADLDAALLRGFEVEADFALLDARECEADPVEACSRLQAGLKGRPRILLLVPHAATVDFEALERAGVREFHSMPLHVGIFVRTLQALTSELGASSSGRGFLDREGLVHELSRRIPTVRAANKNLALITVRLGAEQDAVDWVGLDLGLRSQVERVLQRRLEEVFAELGVAAPESPEVRWSWLRPDTAGLVLGVLDRVQDVARIGGRLQEQLARPITIGDERVAMHTSLGIATCPSDGIDGASLVDAGLEAADRAREEGRNAIQFFNPTMGQWAFERLTLEKSLRDALANNELRVYYQPRIDINTRQILGMEALVRWVHPQLGMVSPAQFIPLAEETGLISPIGEWVLTEACRQNRQWRDAGLAPIRVSVNLSPVQFRDSNLHQRVCAAIESTGLPKDGLELEVTESMLMNNPRVTIETLRKLKKEGIKLSIDDFGTGYSSLSYLKQFPIDSLKIDRSFVRDITNNPDDAAIATAIILMGHSLRLNVVAEGVETESQLAFLRVLQCNEIQGFLFSPPVPAEKATDLLAQAAPMRTAA